MTTLDEHPTVNGIADVGYESPSPFSREYSRIFGAPPVRDISNLRQLATTES